MGLQETSVIFQKIRYRHYFLCHYLPLTSGIDTVSRSLLKFKRGAQPDLENWLHRTRCALRETPISLPPDTIIIRALHHNETSPSQNRPISLDLLGQTLSGHFHFPYLPGLLAKTRPTNTNQALTLRQRQAELQDVWRINPAALLNIANPISNPSGATDPSAPINPAALTASTADNASTPDNTPTPNNPSTPGNTSTPGAHPPLTSILLIDDILTTGATARTIIQTLLQAFPTCTITIFTLAKVE
ncbi:MAG TPA: phosphoribosyltransferase [Puia sp.]|nr:phosphoribosyltransferase [Puia sp.]